ncbi:DUF4870 domain-containing protein [Phycicoccus sp. 3266]|uniref:DUF4870 domain-containing protein n=1 Tax=Phycicoccus sp. 3266 TaxID=2817751 RepID=UPI002861202A|nr:DUF4870 domain-containing protein [Phycicoccus sp. 3266]MDR6861694.1 putative Tic20 family protein [Phycicoccus sp. 3266]
MTQQPQYQPQPAQPMSQQEERTWATLTHVISGVAMVVSAGTLGFVASLIIYLVYRDRGPFVRAHAANAVNVQLTALIGLIVSGVLMVVLVGFVLYPIVVVAAVVLHAIAAMRANAGEWYDPPFTIRFVK